jgi:hypothetical protein
MSILTWDIVIFIFSKRFLALNSGLSCDHSASSADQIRYRFLTKQILVICSEMIAQWQRLNYSAGSRPEYDFGVHCFGEHFSIPGG